MSRLTAHDKALMIIIAGAILAIIFVVFADAQSAPTIAVQAEIEEIPMLPPNDLSGWTRFDQGAYRFQMGNNHIFSQLK